MTKFHMRRRAILAAAPALVAAPYVARAQSGKPEKSKVVLAVGGKSALYYLSVTIAETKGFFKEAGLDVEINDFQGGAKSLEALMGGSADVVAGAYEHTIRMQQRGQAIKGMKFGVTAPGSSTHMLVTYWAAKGGLKASDISAIGLGAGASVIAAIENKSVDGISQTDPAITMLQEKNLIKVVVDTRTMKGNQELFGGAMPAACLYGQPSLLTKTPNTAQALANAIVRADEWLQTASPAEVAKAVPAGYLLGDQSIYEKAFANGRDTISPDGIMPAEGPENCLKFLAAGDPKIDVKKINLAETWTNEFAQRAKKHA